MEPGSQAQDHGLHALCAGPLLQQGPAAVGTLLQQLLEAEQRERPSVHQLTQHYRSLSMKATLNNKGKSSRGQQGQSLAGSRLALEHLPCAQEHEGVHGARPGRRSPAGKCPSSGEDKLPAPPPPCWEWESSAWCLAQTREPWL